jgi:translation initiation factor IF-2
MTQESATTEEIEQTEAAPDVAEAPEVQVEIPDAIVVGELATLLAVTPVDVIKELMKNGVMATITQSIDFDTAAVVAADLGFSPVEEGESTEESDADDEETASESTSMRIVEEGDLVDRAPVVTVLGHVDHGKTTLLDSIRKTTVVEGEAGGITQHIGAYEATAPDGRHISFIDTPGHEAFSQMRARGAQVTDVAVVVVAADDGVMPQTREAIDHVRAAQVPLVVALNKVDVPNANTDRVKQQLMEVGLVPEEYGGDQIVVETSALQGQGIDDLLENIEVVADLQELKANPNREAIGVVLEAESDRHRGVVATLLVQTGTLHQGDAIIAGLTSGRIKAMTNHAGERIKDAGPSTPVQVLGLSEVPPAGERFEVRKNEKEARREAEQRRRDLEAGGERSEAVTLDSLFGEIHQGNIKDFNLIVKADVQGSIDPLVRTLEDLSVDEVKVRVIHAGVGSINESDVQLAAASQGVILGFNVSAEQGAARLAEAENTEIRHYQVIYDVVDDVERAVSGLLDPIYEEEQDAVIEVRAVFRLGRRNAIAGSFVREGTARRSSRARVYRDGVQLYEGEITSLRRVDDDASEVAAGLECGIRIGGFEEFEEGDEIITYHMERTR